MNKSTLAVLDSDLGYVDRFLKYVRKKKNLPFSTVGFSSLDSLKRYLERNRVEILLVTEDMMDKETLNRIHEHPSVKEVILAGDRQDPEARQKCLNRFRSADQIISDIIRIGRLDDGKETEEIPFRGNLIGVYSPVCPVERQSFALAVANSLSGSRSVLFISFERFSGLKDILDIHHGSSISDLIYFFKTSPGKMRETLPDVVTRVNRFDVMIPTWDMEDLDLVADEEWVSMFKLLIECGSYDVIVLDIAEGIRNPETIFGLCKRVFYPDTKQILSENRKREMRDYLIRREDMKSVEKIKEIELRQAVAENMPEGMSANNYFAYCFTGELQEKAEIACYEIGWETEWI